LSEEDLLERCTTEKRLARFYGRGSSPLLDICWLECCRRNRQDICHRALAVIREEIREAQAFNRRATEELT
jgi:hypothetical protein